MGLARDNLFLVGMMGAGKTTLGRQLARRLGKRFVDADHELEARLGVPIPTIFEIEGEQAFRDREEAIIAELVLMTGIVLSTGGGVISRPASCARLRDNGTVLYLHALPDTLWLRVRHARHRPMLHAPNPRGRLAELYRVRDPLYRQVAHHVVDSDRDAVLRLVRQLDACAQASLHDPATEAVDGAAGREAPAARDAAAGLGKEADAADPREPDALRLGQP